MLNERIFEPLGMDETSFYLSSDKSERIAEPNFGAMADNTKVRAMLSGGGGLNSTTEDYVRFAEMLLRGGEYRGTRIIEESTLGLMREKRIGSEVSRDSFSMVRLAIGDWVFICNPLRRIRTVRTISAGAELGVPCFWLMKKTISI